jgi:hypothetical protein
LHAFDYDVLAARAVGLQPSRTAHPEERLTTLDGVDRLLTHSRFWFVIALAPVHCWCHGAQNLKTLRLQILPAIRAGIKAAIQLNHPVLIKSTSSILLEGSLNNTNIRKTKPLFKSSIGSCARFLWSASPWRNGV